MTNLIMNIGKSRISPLYEVATTAIPGSVSPLLSSQEIRKPVNKMLYQNHPFHKYQAPEWKLSNSTWALGKSGPSNSFGLTAIAGIGVPRQVRWSHTDVKFPDFSEVRTSATRDPHDTSIDADRERRFFSYAIAATAGTATIVAGKQIVVSIVQFLLPPKDVVAAAKIEVDLTQIPEGRQITVKWGGKPLFVRHRTAAEIAAEQSTAVSTLKDPAHDADRVKDPRWLVVIGICTHLGCVPLPHLGDFGGYYCPCHGSHYDASGRIRRGPAPGNLPVPDYEFLGPDRILVG